MISLGGIFILIGLFFMWGAGKEEMPKVAGTILILSGALLINFSSRKLEQRELVELQRQTQLYGKILNAFDNFNKQFEPIAGVYKDQLDYIEGAK